MLLATRKASGTAEIGIGMGEPAPTMQSTEETAPRARLVEVHTLAVEQLRDGTFQYMFQARWSDESVTSAQHSFETLYTTHCTLLDLYPEEAGSLDSPRLIPPFPGKKIAKGLTKGARNANAQVLAQKRLREIAAWAAGITAIASVANSREFVHLFDSEAALSSSTAASHGRAAESVTLVGFLVKQGGGHKGWKRRHCLLDDQGKLRGSDTIVRCIPRLAVELLVSRWSPSHRLTQRPWGSCFTRVSVVLPGRGERCCKRPAGPG